MARIVFFLAALTAAGCDDDTTSTTTGDLAAVGDLAVPTDLSQLSCANILSCVAGCGQNLVCQSGCRDAGTTMSKSLYDALTGCTAATCAPGDGSAGACMNATDMRPSCLTCLVNAAAAALNTSNICHAEYVTCASG